MVNLNRRWHNYSHSNSISLPLQRRTRSYTPDIPPFPRRTHLHMSSLSACHPPSRSMDQVLRQSTKQPKVWLKSSTIRLVSPKLRKLRFNGPFALISLLILSC
ncbi:hypothetical protein M5K25_020355 [Dendrobium thyrsiflorum]|uniref:Uncharacterized protein n=1 Tax=Dendrobium thyrsiflorum TaxID=117978 RepID=A0ABD0UAF3_DENTH